MSSTDREDDELKRSPHAVYSDTGRFLKGPTLARERRAIEAKARELNIGLGELVHVFTDAIGVKQCSPCKMRQQTLDVFRIPARMIPWERVLEKVYDLREDPEEISVTWIENDG
jgi:hypothetical protein